MTATLIERARGNSAWTFAMRHAALIQLVVCALIGAAFALWLAGPLLDAWFHSADDHNIVQRIPADGAGWDDWWRMFTAGEVSNLGASLRYRWSLFAIQATEIVLFGADASAMYGVRLAFFAAFLAGCAFASWRAAGALVAVAILLWIATLPALNDVYARSLMIPEAHASAFLGIMLAALAIAVQRLSTDKRIDAPLLIAALAMFIAAGAKENFVASAGPVFLLWVYAMWKRRISWITAAIVLVAFTSPLAVLWTLYGAVSAQGLDFYGRDMSAASRLDILFAALPRAWPWVIGMGALLAASWFGARFAPEAERAALRRSTYWTAAVVAVAGAWVGWETIFYNGENFTDTSGANARYMFPSALIAPLLAAAAAHLVRAHARAYHIRGGLAAGALVAAALLFVVKPFTFPITAAAEAKAQSTRTFRDEIQRAVALFTQHPDWPVLVHKVGFDGMERPYSLHYYLRPLGVRNRMFLRLYDEPNAENRTAFQTRLWNKAVRTTERGDYSYTPIAEYDPSFEQRGECYSISWVGRFPDNCQQTLFRETGEPMIWRGNVLVRANEAER
jgi:hypothetical protein